jgi:hypothetical protein
MPDPANRRRNGPSRRVRLHRTIAASLVLVLAVAVAVLVWRPLGPAAGTSAGTFAAPLEHRASPPPQARDSGSGAAPPQTSPAGASARRAPSAPLTTRPLHVPRSGDGQLTVLPVPGPQSGAEGRVVRYAVYIEGGLPVDGKDFARTVRDTLLDRRGWQTQDHVHFVSVSPREVAAGAPVDVRVTLASPSLTDRLCAPLHTNGQVSCWDVRGQAVLNVRRWLLGASTWGDDVAGYRRYLVNHEVGHGIGHEHVHCTGKSERAPVMLQQTLRLEGCTPWSWPTGAREGSPAPA